MANERDRRVMKLFEEALALDPTLRSAFLYDACEGDADLHENVESLLGLHSKKKRFLDAPILGSGEAVLRAMICQERDPDVSDDSVTDPTNHLVDDARALRPGLQLGDFRIEAPIGVGGMGVVYRAKQISLNRTVALKVLAPHLGLTSMARVRFRREAQAVAKLHHPHLVTVYAEGEHDTYCFFAMELIDGRSLDQVITEFRGNAGPARDQMSVGATPSPFDRSSGRFTRSHFDTIARWVADAADALDYAHKQRVIHRDIKPSNLMLADDGRVTVMDFGLARMLEEPGMTVSGEFLGTPRYMSPEQITAGRAKLDHRTDIYSLGATLYELLTLQPPFPGAHRDEIIAAIMANEPKRPRQIDKHIPVDLETICLKSTEKDPDRRYQTSDEFADDLRRCIHRDAISACRVGPVRRLGKFARRYRTSVTTAVGMVVAVSIAVVLAWKYWPDPRLTLTPPERLTSYPGLTTEPTLTEDGRWLAYASDRGGNDNLDIWLQELDGRKHVGDPTQLTFHLADDREPAFSTDGSKIVFHSERDAGGIYVIPRSDGKPGGKPLRLAPEGFRPRFSPNGTWIAYWKGHRGSGVPSVGGGIFVVSATSGESPRQLQEHFSAARFPVWSPDGDHLLFLGYGTRSPTTSPEERTWDWWVAPMASGPAVKTGAFNVFHERSISDFDRTAPATWIAEPNRVIFSAASGDTNMLWALRISRETHEADGSLQQLTLGAGREVHPWLASGGRLVYANVNSNVDIWSLPRKSGRDELKSEPKQLTVDLAIDAWPSLSSDGTKMAFGSSRSGNWEVWLKDLQTDRLTQLTTNPWWESGPTLTANGAKVIYNSARGVTIRSLDEREPEAPFGPRDGMWHASSDGSEILYQPRENGVWTGRVCSLNISTGTTTTVLDDPEHSMYQAHFSPDDRWISFNAVPSTGPHRSQRSQVFVARYRSGESIERGAWILITNDSEWDDHPRWSPDGNMLYFTSVHDGFRCIFARRLDHESKHALDDPLPIRHFHSARLSMNMRLTAVDLSVALHKIAFTLVERTGNIWMAELTEE